MNTGQCRRKSVTARCGRRGRARLAVGECCQDGVVSGLRGPEVDRNDIGVIPRYGTGYGIHKEARPQWGDDVQERERVQVPVQGHKTLVGTL